MNVAGIEIPSNDPDSSGRPRYPYSARTNLCGRRSHSNVEQKRTRASFDVRQDIFLVSVGACNIGNVLVYRALG
jgi:hypothetical protein